MTIQTRNPGDEAGAPKNIAIDSAISFYPTTARNSTPTIVEDCGSFETIGSISRRVIINSLAAKHHISPALASVAFELAMLGRRAA